ncbi:hypothetical protein C4577_05735 [Candidatus Parcubacteria bacterium]|nr:MAG: hypothetical protein C4577_05735 [Candidatus Parcubacteria bacterium]
MKTDVERREDGSIILRITIPWSEVKEVRSEIEKELLKNLSIPGFRKGKAPQNVAKQKIDKEKLKEETIRKVLPDHYFKALKEHSINPIINPKINIQTFEEDKDVVFTAETAEEPKIDLNNYKEKVKEITAKSKIIVPGKEQKKPSIEEILDVIHENTTINIPKLLIDQETDRLLIQLLDELKTLGVNLDQYLSSKAKTADDLRKEYEEKAKRDLKTEFVLKKIADEEKITVEKKDIDEALNTIKDEAQKQEITKNPYLIAAIIRQQKTINFLLNL